MMLAAAWWCRPKVGTRKLALACGRARRGECDAVRGLRPSELTTSGASRASRRPTAPEGADGASIYYECHRPEQTMLYRLVQQQQSANVIAHTEASTGAELSRFIEDEFDAFLECGILAYGFLRQRCAECGHDKLLAFSCKRRGFCPSCGARRMSQTAAHLVDHVIRHVPVRQWVLSLPIPLRALLAAQPELVTPMLQVVQRVITRHLLHAAELDADEGHGGAVTSGPVVPAYRKIGAKIKGLRETVGTQGGTA